MVFDGLAFILGIANYQNNTFTLRYNKIECMQFIIDFSISFPYQRS